MSLEFFDTHLSLLCALGSNKMESTPILEGSGILSRPWADLSNVPTCEADSHFRRPDGISGDFFNARRKM